MQETMRDTRVAPSPMRKIAGPVGNRTDDLGRESVAEEMNAEKVDRDRGGADWRGDGVHDGGVERAGVEEEKELGRERAAGTAQRGPEEDQHAEGQGQSDAPE